MLKNNGFHNRHSPLPFSPASLFANGEQGWWYDPSNFATLFQDSAGTTPVTAMEQPVGLQLDLSGRGNHRFQATSGNRPVVSARVNLLTKTEQFDDAVWVKSNATVTANATTAPDGTLTADLLNGGVSGTRQVTQFISKASAAIPYTLSCYLKADTSTVATLALSDNTTGEVSVQFNLSTGTAGSVSIGTWTAGSATITPVGNNWYICALTATSPVNTGLLPCIRLTTAASAFGWGADLRVTNQGVNLPVYQRVNTSTDYDSTGFPVYIKPNGSNQFMQTNSIDFTATDKMTVWQGVRKLSDATRAILIELSTTYFTPRTFGLDAPSSIIVNDYRFMSGGSREASGVARGDGFIPPITNVVTGIGNIADDLATLRVNGTQVAQSTADQGTGNYGNYPAYFYMREETFFPFSGNDYGSIARGAASTAAQITAGETYINSKTKAY
jgi:hypothetical protein